MPSGSGSAAGGVSGGSGASAASSGASSGAASGAATAGAGSGSNTTGAATGSGAAAGTTGSVAGSSGTGAASGADGGAPPDASTITGDAGVWPAVADYSAVGPFTTTRDVNTGPMAAYDVFRPAVLGAGGLRHPIVAWANGTMYSLDKYAPLLTHWASHGFVVIAGHTNSTAGGGTIKAALDWMVAQAATQGSPYFGVLDTHATAASGHSQGGGATIAAGAGAPGPVPLTTTMPLMPYLGFEKDLTIIGKQTAPMGNIVATMDTTAPGVADQIYQNINVELVQPEYIGVHTDAMSPAMFGPTLAWLRFRLIGDTQARTWFYPVGTCGLCTNAAYKTVRYKNTPP
jgi:hypothetical protein